ncbi:hypothetical protein IR194_04465 [Exiguobacterium sp. PBE]|nr:hypothetical protein IR194_04465 [Exiguobacterium sp. PBE]
MDIIDHYSGRVKFLVGINGAGKTHALLESLKLHESEAFLLTEDGMALIPRDKKRVQINIEEQLYLYQDETSRGKPGRNFDSEKISDNAFNVVTFCQGILERLNRFSNKSKGQEKLHNIMSIFLTYNLNNINILYFDEPENFLDEAFLKVISDFFDLLIDSGYIIRVATHNSRLLNILKIEIDDIILFHDHNTLSISKEEVSNIFNKTSSAVESIRIAENIQEDASISYKLNLTQFSHAFSNFVDQSLKSTEFYRCLFHKKVIIVEGQSDIVALSFINKDFDSSIEIYNPNGKAFIPFFTMLFRALNKEVLVIIDNDLPLQNDLGILRHPVAISYYLNQIESDSMVKVITHNPDLEGHYEIDLDSIATDLGMSSSIRKRNKGWHKSMAAYIFFSQEENRLRLKQHILEDSEDRTMFELE